MWIDSHCHLTHEYMSDTYTPDQLVEQARAAGVSGMLNISCQVSGDYADVLATAKRFDNVWCTIGTHPHDAGLQGEKDITKERLIEMAVAEPNVVGIGETGLDYYYDNSSREDQEVSFRKHIQACIEADYPIIIHARDADEDVARIMFEEEGAGSRLRGVMHCFSSGVELAQRAVDFGFYISFSGIVTFKQAHELRDIAKTIPLDRILVETDAPFLAPVPYRGKANQPAYVIETGAVLADIHGVSIEDMAKRTTDNFFTLFDRAALS